jgi:hypothetical protein
MNVLISSTGNLNGSVVKSRMAWYKSISVHMTENASTQGRSVQATANDIGTGIPVRTFKGYIGLAHISYLVPDVLHILESPSDHGSQR